MFQFPSCMKTDLWETGLRRGKFQRFLNFWDIHGILILAAAAIKNSKSNVTARLLLALFVTQTKYENDKTFRSVAVFFLSEI